MTMTPNDANDLIGLCNKALEDMRRFEEGTSYEDLQLFRQFLTITEPLLVGSELDPELKAKIPAAGWHKLKSDIAAMRAARAWSRSEGFERYGSVVIGVREALELFAQKNPVDSSAPTQKTPDPDPDPDPAPANQRAVGLTFEALLHPEIVAHALPQFKNGHLRDAVLNGVLAVFGLIRARTGLESDGKALVGQSFGYEKGLLIFSEIETESGKNDQIGFMQIYEGIYTGVRNVKAHSLNHDLDEIKAAQYLVTLSLLARRVDECKVRD